MVDDSRAQALLQRRRLEILNVMWEDTGRYFGSSVGPNISDVTIEVQQKDRDGHISTALMPVIRHPNFSDVTGDVKMDQIRIPVGNQAGQEPLATITLRELLADPTRYLSQPQKGAIRGGSLLAERDTHALVSAQTAFLPVPREGKATFWPVIFNYQSWKKHPAVLTILVTRQGTSMTVVDNARDTLGGGQSWGQRLFFNDHGQRAPLTAERLSDVKEHGVTANGEDAQSLGDDANLMMLIQVPLKVRELAHHAAKSAMDGLTLSPPSAGPQRASSGHSDVEVAVLGHGPQLGPYVELDGLTIQRDARFPVRVTVQFYQATATGRISGADASAFAKQIARVYHEADYVGSLVVPTDLDRQRPTLWSGAGTAPAHLSLWDFPGLYERIDHGRQEGPRRAAHHDRAPVAAPPPVGVDCNALNDWDHHRQLRRQGQDRRRRHGRGLSCRAPSHRPPGGDQGPPARGVAQRRGGAALLHRGAQLVGDSQRAHHRHPRLRRAARRHQLHHHGVAGGREPARHAAARGQAADSGARCTSPAGSARRSRRRTRAASCTATSSPTTCS